MIYDFLLLFTLIMLNAFFAASEIALISLNDNKIHMMAEEGNKKAEKLSKLLKEPGRFLATIQVGVTMAGFLASAFAARNFVEPVVNFLVSIGLVFSRSILESLSLLFITLLLSYFSLVLGELVPKRLAMQNAERISMLVIWPLFTLSTIAHPFVKLLTNSTDFFIRLLGFDPHAEEAKVTEEEIRMLVDVGEEKGAIHQTEKEMIFNIFEFNNKMVSDIMVHRTDIVGVSINCNLDSILELVNKEQYTRFPVYEEDIDNIIGILHIKDIIKFLSKNNNADFDIKSLMRKPFFVPASKRTDEMFKELQINKTHMAIVIDEYGGTAGIITIEDLIEEIMGNIFDEYDDEEPEIVKLDEETYMLKGTVSLDTVKEYFDVDTLPTDDYDTLSGFIIGQLGRIPEEIDTPEVLFSGMLFKVELIEEKRISKVKVSKTA